MAKFKVGDRVEMRMPDESNRTGKITLVHEDRIPVAYEVTDDERSPNVAYWYMFDQDMIPEQPKATGFLARELAAMNEDPTRKYRDANLRKVFCG